MVGVFFFVVVVVVFFTSIIFEGGGTTIKSCLGHPFGQQRPCDYPCVFIVMSVQFDFVWSTRYSPVFLCVSPALSCLVLPCLFN